MNTSLKLDTKAMEALFPEGSEARVELQQAVIQNFVDRHVKIKDTEDLIEYARQRIGNMDRQFQELSTKMLDDYFQTAPWKTRNSSQVQEYINKNILPKMQDMLKPQTAKMMDDYLKSEAVHKVLEQAVKYRTEVYVSKLIEAMLREQTDEMKALVTNNLAKSLNSLFLQAKNEIKDDHA